MTCGSTSTHEGLHGVFHSSLDIRIGLLGSSVSLKQRRDVRLDDVLFAQRLQSFLLFFHHFVLLEMFDIFWVSKIFYLGVLVMISVKEDTRVS